MIDPELSLFQLCDSNFPTGSFSQSFGLETYIQKDLVKDADTFAQWLHIYLHEQLASADGIAARQAYEALEEEDMDKIWELDRLLTVQNLAKETRDGTQRMGDRMLDIANAIYNIPMLEVYKRKMKDKEVFGHPALVFAIVGYYLGVDKETTLVYYLYSVIVGLVQNAVRGIPIGQTAGQKIVYRFHAELYDAKDTIMGMDDVEFGVVSPGLELSQMQHEYVGIRIFSS